MTRDQIQHALDTTERDIIALKAEGKRRFGTTYSSTESTWPQPERERMLELKRLAREYRKLLNPQENRP